MQQHDYALVDHEPLDPIIVDNDKSNSKND